MRPASLFFIGMALILVGFAVVSAGALTSPTGSTSTGGFILIGPVPIVFGSGPNSGMLTAVGAVITVAVVAMYLASFLLWRSRRRRDAEATAESA